MQAAERLRESGLAKGQVEHVDTIARTARSMLVTLDTLLDNDMPARTRATEFDLCRCVEDAVETFYLEALNKSVALRVFYSPDAPTRVVGDEARLRQTLLEVVGSAMRFTSSGSIGVSVTAIEATPTVSFIRFMVSDTARDVDPADREDLLTTEEVEASGGPVRPFSKADVRAIGGQITVRATADHGTMVEIILPFHHAPVESRPLTLGGARVLLACECETTREIIGQYLNAAGAEIHSVQTGWDALNLLYPPEADEDFFDLVVADDEMFYREPGDFARSAIDLAGADILRLLVIGDPGLGVDPDCEALMAIAKPLRRNDLLQAAASHRRDRRAIPRESEPHEFPKLPPLAVKVLVAEDIPINQEVMREHLLDFGCTVIFANNGREAIEQFAADRYDIVLMDCQMPEMDGLTATREIRAMERANKWPRTPIIGVSAHVFERERAACLASQMDDFLSKPYTHAQLYNALDKALRQQMRKTA